MVRNAHVCIILKALIWGCKYCVFIILFYNKFIIDDFFFPFLTLDVTLIDRRKYSNEEVVRRKLAVGDVSEIR